MKEIFKMEMDGSELLLGSGGDETRLAAGPLTQQLLPRMIRPHLEPDEQAMLDFLVDAFGGCAGVTIREREDAVHEGTEAGLSPDAIGAGQEPLPARKDEGAG